MLVKNGLTFYRGEFKKLDVKIEDGVIVDVGRFQGEGIDAGRMIVVPGFVNSHMHASMSLIRGIPPLSLDEWVESYVWKFEKGITPEESYYGALVSCMEMLKNGVTCFSDMHFNMLDVAKACKILGIRACLSVVMMDAKNSPTNFKKSVKESLNLIKEIGKEKTLKPFVSPCTVRLASKELFLKAREISEKHSVGFHLHSSETKKDVEFCLKHYGKRPIEFFEEIGILGENTILAHCIYLNEKEIEILSKTKTNVSHCLSSNLKLSSGIAKIPKFLEKEINVSLGIDTPCANDTTDILREARLVSLLHRIPKEKILEMIFNGKALGLNIGRIEKGYFADLVMLKKIQGFPYKNLASNLVYSMDGRCVDTVVVNGEVVVENKKILKVKEDRILEKALKVAERVWDRLEQNFF